ncbi:MAG: FxDxF family PEP-CTERM protein [Burkholderiaceae bacterium]
MTTIKTLSALALSAVLAAASFGAHAANDLTQTQDITLIGNDNGYTASPTAIHGEAGSFVDTFNFTYTGAALVDVSLVTVGMGNEQRITFTEAWLNGVALTIRPLQDFDGTLIGQADLFKTPVNGNFTLVVKGYAGGDLAAGTAISASYATTFNALASPVPEPEGAAMFLAGLGMMGVMLARRRRG